MISSRTQRQAYRTHRRDSRSTGRRFWSDLLLACLAGIILALTVAAVSSQGGI
jgi:hypothetical protein